MALNLTIKHKLFVFNLLALSFVAGVAGSGYWGNRALTDSQAEIIINFSAMQNHLDTDMMHDAIRADVLSALYASKTGNVEKQQNTATDFQKHAEKLRKKLEINTALPLRDDIVKSLEQLKPALESYITRADAIVAAASKDHAAAYAQFPVFMQSFSTLEKDMATLSDLIKKNTHQSKQKGEIAAEYSIKILAIVTMVSFVALLLGYYFLSKGAEIQRLNTSLNARMAEQLRLSNNELQARADALHKAVNEEMHAKEHAERSSIELTSYIQAIGQHAIISVADLAGAIIQVNDRFCEISGYTQAELLGQDHRIVNSGTHPKEFFAQMWATITRGDIWRGEFCNRAKDGSLYWVDSAIVPIKDERGHVVRFISVRIDISKSKRAQDEILRLNVSLEEQVQRLGKKNKQSQTLTEELHSQQEELRQSNEELEEKNHLLADQKLEVEYKNREIETSKLTLQEHAEQLALTSKYKSEFLSSMSHELRTPLNSLLILAQLLAENPEHNLSEQQIEYAKIIQGSGKDLLELINDILDLSKIESGIVTLELDDASFADVGEQVERSFRHVAESRSLGFSVELAPNLPESLYTDAQRLQQIMKNLLSNAFKFTQKGQVSVRIAAVESGWSVEHDGLNRAQAVLGFFVTDTGIGLAADKQKIIFEAFQQADTGTTKKYGGTGLGLSISRELAWLLGGELHLVESAPGQGSTFVLYLPLRALESGQGIMPKTTQRTPVAQEGAADANPHPPAVADDRAAIKPGERTLLSINPAADLAGILSAASLAGKKVLLVDDDMRNIFALAAVLERHKMAVLSAENGRAALEELVQNPDVDIVLMDIMMPEMDGYETMRQIRQMKQFESLPMIALTAKAMKGDREKCIAAGASDYVSKPVDTDQLVSLLRVWLYK